MLGKRILTSNAWKSAGRCLSTANPIRLSMTEELPGFGSISPPLKRSIPKLKPARELKRPETLSTTLPCGLTVATRETYETVIAPRRY